MNRKAGLNLIIQAATESVKQWARDVYFRFILYSVNSKKMSITISAMPCMTSAM